MPENLTLVTEVTDREPVTVGSDVAVDAVVVMAPQRIGIALTALSSGVEGMVRVAGIVALPADSGAYGQGARVYWSTANSRITTTVGSNTYCGRVYGAQNAGANGDRIKINLNAGSSSD